MPRGNLLVALLTPFTSRGEIDIEALQAHAENLHSAGVDGFFLCGTTGEGALLDDDEIAQITRAVSECAPRAAVVTQVGRPSTRATLRLMSKALEAGAHGVTAVTPYYYELSARQLEAH